MGGKLSSWEQTACVSLGKLYRTGVGRELCNLMCGVGGSEGRPCMVYGEARRGTDVDQRVAMVHVNWPVANEFRTWNEPSSERLKKFRRVCMKEGGDTLCPESP